MRMDQDQSVRAVSIAGWRARGLARCAGSARSAGFTLIELLVVITIISLLIAILLPALGVAQRASKYTRCLANMRSIGQAMLTYEADNRRLPLHVREWFLNGALGPHYAPSSPAMFPASVRFGNAATGLDIAKLYAPYMDVEYFVCPLVRPWSINEELNRVGSTSTNADYYLTPGYFGDGTGSTMTSYFTKSDQVWIYNGRKMTVLAGDKLYFNADTPPSPYIVANHPEGMGNAADWRPGSFGGFAFRVDTADDTVRYDSPANHVFTDGSAKSVKGDTSQIPVNALWTARPNANYLMPTSD